MAFFLFFSFFFFWSISFGFFRALLCFRVPVAPPFSLFFPTLSPLSCAAGMDVTVYERTEEFARFGGPIQFASNALSVLKAIDDKLFDRVMEKFTFTGTRTCGIKDGIRADGSFRMTGDSVNYLFDPSSPADWFVKFPLKQCADLYNLPYTGVIDRPDLQEILLDECKKIKPDFIQNGKAVVGYENLPGSDGVRVKLQDGQTQEADVLVGSDGIWSAVRAQMYGEEIKKTSKNKMMKQGCTYSGYTVFAGETTLETNDYFETGYKVYIGPQRYFVTSDVGDGRIQWYAFFSLPPGTKRAPSGWGGSTRDTQADEEEDLVAYIKSLHGGWSDEIHYVLDRTPKGKRTAPLKFPPPSSSVVNLQAPPLPPPFSSLCLVQNLLSNATCMIALRSCSAVGLTET